MLNYPHIHLFQEEHYLLSALWIVVCRMPNTKNSTSTKFLSHNKIYIQRPPLGVMINRMWKFNRL